MFGKQLKNTEEIEDEKESLWSRLSFWWWEKTRYTWWGRLSDKWSDFKMGIKNLFTWFPIVWKDRPYDSAYIFDMLYFKIKQTRDFIVKKDRHTDVFATNKYCTIAMKLIIAVREETYSMEYLDYFEDEFKWLPTGRTLTNKKGKQENLFELEKTSISSCPEPYFKKYPHVYKKIMQQVLLEQPDRIKDEQFIALLIAHKNHQRARKLLFKILEREIEGWWD